MPAADEPCAGKISPRFINCACIVKMFCRPLSVEYRSHCEKIRVLEKPQRFIIADLWYEASCSQILQAAENKNEHISTGRILIEQA